MCLGACVKSECSSPAAVRARDDLEEVPSTRKPRSDTSVSGGVPPAGRSRHDLDGHECRRCHRRRLRPVPNGLRRHAEHRRDHAHRRPRGPPRACVGDDLSPQPRRNACALMPWPEGSHLRPQPDCHLRVHRSTVAVMHPSAICSGAHSRCVAQARPDGARRALTLELWSDRLGQTGRSEHLLLGLLAQQLASAPSRWTGCSLLGARLVRRRAGRSAAARVASLGYRSRARTPRRAGRLVAPRAAPRRKPPPESG
jgi:hypothetical protein